MSEREKRAGREERDGMREWGIGEERIGRLTIFGYQRPSPTHNLIFLIMQNFLPQNVAVVVQIECVHVSVNANQQNGPSCHRGAGRGMGVEPSNITIGSGDRFLPVHVASAMVCSKWNMSKRKNRNKK